MESNPRYSVKFRKKAEKQLIRLHPKAQLKFGLLFEELEEDPRPYKKEGYHQLAKNKFRCWVGWNHRIEWMVDDEKSIVTIVAVGTKEDMS